MVLERKQNLSHTSGISKGTLRTCMPWRTTGLGCNKDNAGATSCTSFEVKLEDWDCLSRSLENTQQDINSDPGDKVQTGKKGCADKTYCSGSS